MTKAEITSTPADTFRVSVVSDTHGRLRPDLLMHLEEDAPDAIVHAGDVCSMADYERIAEIAPTYVCYGNNDWPGELPKDAANNVHLTLGGLRWEVCHYRERLDLSHADIGICGHTHRPFVETTETGVVVMNPGSPTYPRSAMGPTYGRIAIADKEVVVAEIVELPQSDDHSSFGFWR